MTDEQINEAIAKHCGKKIISLPFIPNKITVDEDTVFTRGAEQQWYSAYPSGASVNRVPSYCKDLNLIHELESLYIEMDEWWSTYLEHIGSQWSCRHEAHATARQRAEAFLKTVGKWKS